MITVLGAWWPAWLLMTCSPCPSNDCDDMMDCSVDLHNTETTKTYIPFCQVHRVLHTLNTDRVSILNINNTQMIHATTSIWCRGRCCAYVGAHCRQTIIQSSQLLLLFPLPVFLSQCFYKVSDAKEFRLSNYAPSVQGWWDIHSACSQEVHDWSKVFTISC